MRQNIRGAVEYLTFPALEQTGLVEHLFTTRLGGASQGIFSSMNLSFSRGDSIECVRENYKRVAKILGCSIEDMVASRQTHTTNIRLVTKEDAGKGVVRAQDYEAVDGLITREKGIALATLYADCVPLYFLDPVHKAIGLAHSGWRGTVNEMGKAVAEAMGKCFGTQPEQILAAIGPSICQACYEVGEDVAVAFEKFSAENNPVIGKFLEEIAEREIFTEKGEQAAVLLPGRETGKYQLNLWLANLLILRGAGIPLKNISFTDICTCHNPDYLFSHRASGGKRGNLGAFLMLKP